MAVTMMMERSLYPPRQQRRSWDRWKKSSAAEAICIVVASAAVSIGMLAFIILALIIYPFLSVGLFHVPDAE